MSARYRSHEEIRQIIRAVIADTNPPPLSHFNLEIGEEGFFRARAAKAVNKLAKNCAGFKAYYVMPTERPFFPVIALSATVIALCLIAGVEVYRNQGENPAYPIYAALISIAAVAAGWIVVGGISHRNTIRQNTNALLFARFANAPFGEAMHRFHSRFHYNQSNNVTRQRMLDLINSGKEDDLKDAMAAVYLLNYLEFVGSGVLRGDFDAAIVEANIKGIVAYYYDKCEPYIREANSENPRVYEHLMRLRAAYREP